MLEYYVLFMNSSERNWWNVFTTDGYEHVDALLWHEDKGVWQIFRPDRNGTCIDIIYKSKEQLLDEIQKDGNIKVIRFDKIMKYYNRRSFFVNGTCVGAVKDFLNIKKPFIFTPYQLYKYLIRNGGTL